MQTILRSRIAQLVVSPRNFKTGNTELARFIHRGYISRIEKRILEYRNTMVDMLFE